MLLKNKIFFALGIIFMIGIVNALIIDSPSDGKYFQNLEIVAISELTNSNVSFYLNNETTFGEENLICFFNNTVDDEELICTSIIAENNIMDIGSIDFYVKFDNHTGNLYDSSGNGMVMTLTNGVPIYHKYNGATLGYYNTNFSGQVIFSDLTPTFTLGNGDDFSMGIWVYDNFCLYTDSHTIALQGLTSNSYMAFGIAGSALRGYGRPYLSCDDAQATGGNSIPCREWTFISATYDGTTHEARTYINGEFNYNRTVYDGNGFATTTQWRVGAWEATNWNGSIDEAWTDKGVIWSDEDMLNAYKIGEGKYYFKVNETDGSSSTESSTLSYYIDRNNPTINLSFPRYETKNGFMNFSSVDTNSFSNVSLNLTLNGVQIDYVDFTDGIIYTNETDLAKGDYNLTILATDLSGRTTTKEKLFTVVTSVAINLHSDSGIGILRFFSDAGSAIMRFFGT